MERGGYRGSGASSGSNRGRGSDGYGVRGRGRGRSNDGYSDFGSGRGRGRSNDGYSDFGHGRGRGRSNDGYSDYGYGRGRGNDGYGGRGRGQDQSLPQWAPKWPKPRPKLDNQKPQHQQTIAHTTHAPSTLAKPKASRFSSGGPLIHKPRSVSGMKTETATVKEEPMRRPDNGGENEGIKTVNLLTNHFRVNYNPNIIIRQYDVNIKEDLPNNQERNTKLSKTELAKVRNELSIRYRDFPISTTAYDGQKNIFSTDILRTGKLDVPVPIGEDNTRTRNYKVTVQEVNTLELTDLVNFPSIPRDVLQALDVVMKEHPSNHMLSIGKSFYLRNIVKDLNKGIAAFKGYRHTLKPTKEGLSLCFDYSFLPLRKPIRVVEYVKSHLKIDWNNESEMKRDIQKALVGLKVTVNHRTSNQIFTIVGLSDEPTKYIEFDRIDQNGNDKTRLVDYFQTKYGRNIVYRGLPCLDLGKRGRKNFVPMEFCTFAEGQIYPKDDLGPIPSKTLRDLSLVYPNARKDTILKLIKSDDGPNSDEIIHNFGMNVEERMISVTGRVLKAPKLKLGSGNKEPNPVQNHWNFMHHKLTKGSEVHRWAVLDFTCGDETNYRMPEYFVEQLIDYCWRLGLKIQGDYIHEEKDMDTFSDAAKLENMLREVVDDAKHIDKDETQPVLVLCAMPYKDKGYKNLKWIAETKFGLVTQCFVTHTASIKDHYLMNLALKINAKFGGSNVELADGFNCFKKEDKVMFIGADVNHPSPKDKTSPSIVAVVGSLNWPGASRYAARVIPQEHRKEEIQEFGDTCLDLINAYANQNNGILPNKIVIFRDGGSDGQFDMVLNKELSNLMLKS